MASLDQPKVSAKTTGQGIAEELGIQISSVGDVTKKLYQSLDVHNPAELGTKIRLGQKQDETPKNWWRAG